MSARQIEVLSSASHSFQLETKPPLSSIEYFVSRLFSCWHIKMSRPFTHERETYRTCLRCGMRRKFDIEKWKSSGRFYSQTIARKIDQGI